MSDHNYALYYPTIEFKDYEWLWGASLLWDRIYKIVPDGFEPDEPPNVVELQQDGEVGIPIYPKKYAREVAKEFIDKMDSPNWDAAALTHSEDDSAKNFSRLHEDKVDDQLRSILIAKGQASSQGKWLHVPTEFSSHYMTYLANAIAKQNNLHLVSDIPAAWTCSTYFRFDGSVEDYPREDFEKQLALLLIKDFIPANLSAITTKELKRFRRDRRDQRQRFMNAVQKAAKSISQCTDPTVTKDMVQDLKKDIEASLIDFKRSADLLKVRSWTGTKSLSFPVLTTVLSTLVPLDPASITVLSTVGVGLGVHTGIQEYQQKMAELERKSEYSYLIQLKSNWINKKGQSDYTKYLWKQMEEFIND